jgi:hypothetical protein
LEKKKNGTVPLGQNRSAQMENRVFFPPFPTDGSPADFGHHLRQGGARWGRGGSLDQGGPIEGGFTVRRSHSDGVTTRNSEAEESSTTTQTGGRRWQRCRRGRTMDPCGPPGRAGEAGGAWTMAINGEAVRGRRWLGK